MGDRSWLRGCVAELLGCWLAGLLVAEGLMVVVVERVVEEMNSVVLTAASANDVVRLAGASVRASAPGAKSRLAPGARGDCDRRRLLAPPGQKSCDWRARLVQNAPRAKARWRLRRQLQGS